MNIKEIKKKYNLTNQDIASCFGLDLDAYKNSSAKGRYERAVEKLYDIFSKKSK